MIPLIDTHQHLIYPDLFDYPWISAVPALQRPFTLADYSSLTNGTGIEASLFMEVDVAAIDSGNEARFFMKEAEAAQNSLCGVIASARPESDQFEDLLDSINTPFLKGIRRVLHTVDDSISQSALFRSNIASLTRRGLPFDLCILPHQCEIGLALVDACPEATFILDHCGNPNIREPKGFDQWRATIAQYAERPHLNAKLSGIVASGIPGQTGLEEVRPYLDATLESFGAERLVWGSDWPVCTLTTSLPNWINIFRQWLATLSLVEQSAIASVNARRIYKL